MKLIDKYLEELIINNKNLVFIGEAGSGKTEIALNMAAELVGMRKPNSVHFFDMDQTKPLFRARDKAGEFSGKGIIFHYQSQYLDAPTVVSGVNETLYDAKRTVIMDIGGGAMGSHMIGQFSKALSSEDTKVFYIVNPYRPWSGSREDIEQTMTRVLHVAGLSTFSLVANPNFGIETSVNEVLEGIKRVKDMFPDKEIEFVCAKKSLIEQISKETAKPVFPLSLNILPDIREL